MKRAFTQFVAEKAAEKAANQEKELVKKMAEDVRFAAAAREAVERAAIEARGESSMAAPNLPEDPTSTEVPAPMAEDIEDEIPLRFRKRKAVLEPEGISMVPPFNPQDPRGNIFTDQTSAMGAQLFMNILSPNENLHLRGVRPTQKLFAGASRVLSGAQYLISAFADVAASAKKKEKKCNVFRDTNKQLKEQLDKIVEVHNQEILEFQLRLDVFKVELEKAQASTTVADSRAEALQDQLNSAGNQIHILSEEVVSLKSERDSLKTSLKVASATIESMKKSEEEWRTRFLASKEFKAELTNRAFVYFETGFEKCRDQYTEVGLVPDDPKNFPDLSKAVASLPDDE